MARLANQVPETSRVIRKREWVQHASSCFWKRFKSHNILLNFSHSLPLILVPLAIGVAVTIFLDVSRVTRRASKIQLIPGPVDRASWPYGNLPKLLLTQLYGESEFQWNKQYGSTYRIKGCFSEDILFTSDPAAIRFILNDGKLFDLISDRRLAILTVLGEKSMLGLRNGGQAHRRTRNAFSPALTPSRLQSYVPITMDIARKQYSEKSGHNSAAVDIYRLLQHVTSDIIGEETDGGSEVVQSHLNVALDASDPVESMSTLCQKLSSPSNGLRVIFYADKYLPPNSLDDSEIARYPPIQDGRSHLTSTDL
ncbi:cytochrome P450 [Marasmius fiardii PR-910]|nr:cytochrome P450 [Marasmius fiardii PR-910]